VPGREKLSGRRRMCAPGLSPVSVATGDTLDHPNQPEDPPDSEVMSPVSRCPRFQKVETPGRKTEGTEPTRGSVPFWPHRGTQ
jgi:hypothetical protein